MRRKNRLKAIALCLALSLSQLSPFGSQLVNAAEPVITQTDDSDSAPIEPNIENPEQDGQEGVVQESNGQNMEQPADKVTQELPDERPQVEAGQMQKEQASRAADINAPIIEEVELDVQDQRITSLDTPVNIRVKTRDAEGNIYRIQVKLSGRDQNGQWVHLGTLDSYDIGKNSADVTLTYDLKAGCAMQCAVSEVKVVDDSGNIARYDVGDGWSEEGYKYQFAVDESILEKKVPNIVALAIEQREVAQDQFFSMELTFEEEVVLKNTDVILTNLESGKKVNIGTGWTGTGSTRHFISVYMSSGQINTGKWVVSGLQLQNGHLNSVTIDEEDLPGTKEDRTITVLKGTAVNNEVFEEPVFNITGADGKEKTWKPGMILEVGDQIKAQIALKDNQEIVLTEETQGSMYFQHPLWNSVEADFNITIQYNSQSNRMEGVRTITDKDYPSEWYLSYVSLWSDSSIFQNWDVRTDKYFYITREGTLAEPTQDVQVNLSYLSNNNISYETISLKDVTRRAKLKPLIEDKLKEISNPEGLKIQDWMMSDGTRLDDVKVLDGYITLSAVYDKAVSWVRYEYLNQQGQMVSDIYKRTDDVGSMTYQMLFDEIKKVITDKVNAEAVEGISLEGWTVNERVYDLEAKINGMVRSYSFIPEYDKRIVKMNFGYMNSEGKWEYKEVDTGFYDKNVTYQELLDRNVPFTENPYQELNFAGWKVLRWGMEIGDLSNKVEGIFETINCNAYYEDKSIVNINPYYYAKGDTVDKYGGQEGITLVLDKGTTYQTVLDKLNALEHLEGMKFKAWSNLPNGTTVIPEGHMELWAYAQYDNFTVNIMCSRIYDVNGNFSGSNVIVPADKDETYKDVLKRIKAVHYEGLEVESWKIVSGAALEDTVVEYAMVIVEPKYKNCLVSVHMSDAGETVYNTKEVMDKGTSFTLPVLTQYPDMKWVVYGQMVPKIFEPGEKVVINESTSFLGTLTPDLPKPSPEDPEVPGEIKVTGVSLDKNTATLTSEGEQIVLKAAVQPDNASDKALMWSSDNKNVAAVDNGVVTAVFNGTAKITATTLDGGFKAVCTVNVKIPPKEIPQDKKEEAKEEIKNTQEGGSVTIDMEDATVIPKDILEVAKENKVDIVVDMGDYTWTIKSDTIIDGKLENINLEVRKVSEVIPSDLIGQLVGENHYEEISLTHNGDFGFRAELSLKVDAEYQGKYGNLYYHDSSGKMVFMNAGIIGEDGTVNLEFSHASNYLVVINDVIMDQIISVTQIRLDKSELELKTVGETAQINAIIQPENATDKGVIWSSMNEAVATVESGVVTAVANGETVITAVTKDGGYRAECKVRVALSEAGGDNPSTPENPSPKPPEESGQGGGQEQKAPVVSKKREAAQTGDYQNILLPLGMLCLAAVVGTASVKIRKKNVKQEK